MTVRLAAVCAIYGGYDLIPPVPDGVDDAVLVTDVPVRSGWRNVVEPSDAHPRLAAKRPKARPDLYTDCEASLWIDGSIHVRDGAFVALTRALLSQHDLVLTDHPEERNCLYEEAEHCWDWPKYVGEPLREQASHYRASGMPEQFGLWAAGCIARRHTPAMRSLGDAWLDEMQRWTIQDQVSLPYLLWRENLKFSTFGIDQLKNDYFDLFAHAEELRDHRRTVLQLESDAINATSRADYFAMMFHRTKAEYDRLLNRRAVRLALSLAAATKLLRRRRPGH